MARKVTFTKAQFIAAYTNYGDENGFSFDEDERETTWRGIKRNPDTAKKYYFLLRRFIPRESSVVIDVSCPPTVEEMEDL